MTAAGSEQCSLVRQARHRYGERDLHDIGKNLVKMILEGAGFQTINLGTDDELEGFVAAVHKHQPKLLGTSALLPTTMVQMKTTIEALGKAGLCD